MRFVPDYAMVAAFLQRYGLPRILVAIDLNGNKTAIPKLIEHPAEADAHLSQINHIPGLWQWYFAAGDSHSDRRTRKDIYQVPSVWADIDPPAGAKPHDDPKIWQDWKAAFSPDIFHTQPTFIIDSGSGFQPFWILDDPISPEHAKLLLKAIQQAHNTDSSVVDVARIMRLPGTYNNKPNVDQLAHIPRKWDTGITYHPAELTDYYPPTPEPPLQPRLGEDILAPPAPNLRYGFATKSISQRIDNLRATREGDPNSRHRQALGIVAMCVGQDNVSELQISNCIGDVRDALAQNGYTEKYGDRDVTRIIRDAVQFGRLNPLKPLNINRTIQRLTREPPVNQAHQIAPARLNKAPPVASPGKCEGIIGQWPSDNCKRDTPWQLQCRHCRRMQRHSRAPDNELTRRIPDFLEPITPRPNHPCYELVQRQGHCNHLDDCPFTEAAVNTAMAAYAAFVKRLQSDTLPPPTETTT